jgi:hypothetical protein
MSRYDRILEAWPHKGTTPAYAATPDEASKTAAAVSHSQGPQSEGMASAVKAMAASDAGNHVAAAAHHVNAAMAHNDAGHDKATTAHLNAAKSHLAECMGQ